MTRLVTVSNRLPLGENLSGGLVVALKNTLSETNGLWVGHSGDVTEHHGRGLVFHDGMPFGRASFDLTQDEYSSYYLGYSNSVLWPVCHGRPDLIDFAPNHLAGYRQVNANIANLLIPHLKLDDHVWVQDYHLFPLGAELRKRGFAGPLGHFLHIPFPDPSNLAYLPDVEEFLMWFSHYDLLGFQTVRDLSNFRKWVQVFSDCDAEGDDFVRLFGRLIRVGAFPVGIDSASFSQEACNSSKIDQLIGMDDVCTMIGVDRLDYTKGIPHRLRAMRMLLETYPDLKERVSLIQVASPTRSDIGVYQQVRRETEHLVGNINGEFATFNWTPIRSIHQHLPRASLAGLYRQARIGLVTPLADGMNLVAKEYVSAQDALNPGVLILSRFAGAAEQLTEALLVNPHNPTEVADTIYRAVTMGIDERQHRHAALKKKVMAQDVTWWSNSYLHNLQRIPAISTENLCDACGICRTVPDGISHSRPKSCRTILPAVSPLSYSL